MLYRVNFSVNLSVRDDDPHSFSSSVISIWHDNALELDSLTKAETLLDNLKKFAQEQRALLGSERKQS